MRPRTRGRFRVRAAGGVLLALLASCEPFGDVTFTIYEPEAFHAVVEIEAELAVVADGMPYVEGPVWLPDEGALVFSAMQADELKRWRPGLGLDTFRSSSGRANGNVLDEQGRLVTCEHATRRVSRTLANGTIETLVDRYLGRRLSSPNDVTVRSDGSIWFTDPPYGLEGTSRELGGNYVFRFDPATGELAIVEEDFELPNGIAFAPDERTLYVSDSGAPRVVRAFDVTPEGTLANGRVLHRVDAGRGEPDGMCVARDGTLFVAVGEGLDVLAPNGSWVGTIHVPRVCRPARNVCFGGEGGSTLFLTGGSALCSIDVLVQGW